ncbi:MAG TPA: tripartite tricarboxylate transporter substrate-binding protein [Pseudolabrys sp.]|nr:tripartite tricarboxylate transporter substrate-binding protein [Pseudolabrys sp.]
MAASTSVALPRRSRGGNLKAIATLSRERAAIMPELASAHEQGLTDFNVTTWNAFLAPKGTPLEIVAKLNEAMSKTLDTPALQELLTKYGVAPERRSPAYLATFIPEEIARWPDRSRRPASSRTNSVGGGPLVPPSPARHLYSCAPRLTASRA